MQECHAPSSAARARNFPCHCRKKIALIAAISEETKESGAFSADLPSFMRGGSDHCLRALPRWRCRCRRGFALWADEEAPKAQELAKASRIGPWRSLPGLGGCGARRGDLIGDQHEALFAASAPLVLASVVAAA